jgi:hypothetical protein
MKLYAWKPKGNYGRSWFVIAETKSEAISSVEIEMSKRRSLNYSNNKLISDYECFGWGTDYYELSIAYVGEVITSE